MAEDFENAPQALTFANRSFLAQLLSFTGTVKREYATHKSLKRSGSRIEDQSRASRRLEAKLVFTRNGTTTAAAQYLDFEAFINRNPFGLLVHPTSGQFRAFCEGPQEDVDLSRSRDSIDVRVSWIEDQIDATIASDTPDVATSAQNVSDQTTTANLSMATYSAEFVRSGLPVDALNSLDDALAQVDSFADPVNSIRDLLGSIAGVSSKILGTLDTIIVAHELLMQDVENYVGSSSDLFTGTGDSTAAGTASTIANLISTIEGDAESLIDLIVASTPTPAGSAETVGQIEELVAYCITLDDAIRASRPPTIEFRVPDLMDLITVARISIPDRFRERTDILARASTILGLNHITNPAAIPGGTILLVPAR